MISIIKRLVKNPDKRRSSLGREEFDYKLTSYLKLHNKDISDSDARYLLTLYEEHRDSDIDEFLKSL